MFPPDRFRKSSSSAAWKCWYLKCFSVWVGRALSAAYFVNENWEKRFSSLRLELKQTNQGNKNWCNGVITKLFSFQYKLSWLLFNDGSWRTGPPSIEAEAHLLTVNHANNVASEASEKGLTVFAAHTPHALPTLHSASWPGWEDLVTIQELSVHILKICLMGALAVVSWSAPESTSTELRPKCHPAQRGTPA